MNNKLIEEYVNRGSFQNENANANFSLSGLKSHIAHEILKEEQLDHSPAGSFHKSGYLYLHDLDDGDYSGYCVLGKTKISLANGECEFANRIKIGDELIAHDGEKISITTVTKVMDRNVDEILRIRFNRGDKQHIDLYVTKEHPIMLTNYKWINAGDLKIDDEVLYLKTIDKWEYLGINKQSGDKNHQYNPEIDSWIKDNQQNDYQISNGRKVIEIEKLESKKARNRKYNFKVYNYHCEPNNNFFANGILVHNCYGSDLLSLLMKGIANPSGGSSNPAKHFDVVVDHIVNYFYISQNEWAGAQSFSNFDTLISPFIYYDKLNYQQVKQGMQRMIYNLSYPLRASYQSVFSNLSFDLKCPKHMKNEPAIIGGMPQDKTFGEFQKEMNMLNMAYLEVMLEGDKDGRPHTFPISTYSITPDFDWNSDVTKRLFELTAKFGLPYFMSYLGSGLDPSSVRAMCCLKGNTKIISKGKHGISYQCINNLDRTKDIKVLINGEFKEAKWFKMECDNLISTTFVNGLNVEFSPDHPCITKCGIINAEDLTINDWMSFSLDGYEGKDGSYDLGRFIGLYLAEGSQKKSGVVFSFNETETEYINFVIEFASNNFGATYTKSLSMNGIGENLKVYNISINSKTVENLIKEFIGGNLAINKHLKSKVFKMSKEFRQGLFDGEKEGDGSTRGRVCTASKQLSEDIACLISSLGGIAGITVDRRTKEDGELSDNPLYLIRPYSNGARRSYKNIYEYDDEQNIIWIKIKEINIRNPSNEYVYDFEMDTNEHIFQLANGLITHNCRLQMDLNEIIDTSKGGLWNSGINTGSLGVVTINMPLLGYKNQNNIESFYNQLDTLLDAAKAHLTWKRGKVDEGFKMGLMPFTQSYLKDFSTFFSTIGVIGINECCINMFGKPIYECDKFVNDVLKYINIKTKEFTKETGYPWNLEQSPAEGSSHKLAMADKEKYPDIYVNGSEGNYYYTNSSHINVADGLGLGDTLRIQQEFNKHYTGGTLFHIFAGEGSPNAMGVKDLIKNICTNTSIPYLAFTKAYAICENCGMTDDITGICPTCNCETDCYDRVTGYYRAVKNFNAGKLEEFKNRHRFF